MRRILYCGEYTGFAGGIERYAFQTARHLRAAGWRVDWYGTRSERGEAQFRSGFDAVVSAEAALAGDHDLAILHKLPDPELLTRLREKFGERLVFLAHDHDLYCPRRYYYTPFGRINCHRACAPFRCWCCSRLVSPRKWSGLRKHHAALLAELRGHHAAVLSGFMRDNLLRNNFRAEAIHLLPPVVAVPETVVRTASDGPLRILYVGQLIRGKGVDLMLKALALLRIPWRAVIVGDGNDRAMLEGLAADLRIADRVRFTGWTDEPETFFADCDAAVFPSRWQEPFGLSGAEALAHGVPVAAFDIGGVREWLTDGRSGFAVPEQDIPALAEKLELFYREPELRKKMGDAGRESVRERFSPERFLAAVENLTEAVKP